MCKLAGGKERVVVPLFEYVPVMRLKVGFCWVGWGNNVQVTLRTHLHAMLHIVVWGGGRVGGWDI